MQNQENNTIIENDYLEKHPITIIDIDGELINIDKDFYTDHTPAFLKLSEELKGLLYGFVKDPKNSSGYDLATFVAASGYIILWPLDINKTDMQMISIPEIPTKQQIKKLKEMYFLFEDKEVYATNSKFKKRNSHIPRTVPLSDSGKYDDMVSSLNEYFKVVEQLDECGEEIDGDFRNRIRG